ncbi:hypothetical protein M427DRAFT_41643 [Gonapodya prolifera JEL478]|uniref:Endoplasmic reticulum junction formation protein lunapark n=1 Tax=Gonapodya prolifera (strain JEL478) TaxID=1344416 RepID=A0A139ATF5_GONPJ|nr:hypothetical protein M427DRAFT_41643 [Gonapodya prolifera JEL478]|eukprot:KXS19775.1 hypothetical protein M427DRAFT_41643 [Gonapodya prolifera JEL478]
MFSADSGSNFEEQLGELDTRIRRAEIALSELRLQRQTVISQWHLYSIGVWAAYLTWFVLYGWGAGNMDTTKMGEIAAIPGAAVVIYYVGVLISGFYIRRQQFEESNLDVLKRKKKEKACSWSGSSVEELKKMTKFYETQRLLEKYDENAARNAALANQDELHPPGHSSQRRSPSNQRHPSAARNDGPRQPNVDQAGSSMQPGGSPNRPQVHGFPAQQSTPVAPNNPPLLSDSQYAALAAQLPPESRPDTPAVDTLHGSLAPGPYDSGYNLALGPRPWFDRIFDAIIGDHLDGPNNKYALICTRCHVHNGLASPLEFESIGQLRVGRVCYARLTRLTMG